jgi:hypothetical protein
VRTSWLALAIACSGAAPITKVPPKGPVAAPTTAPAPVPVIGSLDAHVLPAGPFRSAGEFCRTWRVQHDPAVAAQSDRCAADPNAGECMGCGLVSYCEARVLAGGPVGPFRSAELVEPAEDSCSANACYLAVTDARGTWFVHEVIDCTPGEGISASLDTISLVADGQALVWRYHHRYDVSDGQPTEERVTVRCRSGTRAPECTAESELDDAP